MRNVFNHLLATLCMADMMVILTNLVFSINTLCPNNPFLSTLVPVSDGLCHIAVTASVFLTIAITVERFYAVCSPFTYQTRVVDPLLLHHACHAHCHHTQHPKATPPRKNGVCEKHVSPSQGELHQVWYHLSALPSSLHHMSTPNHCPLHP